MTELTNSSRASNTRDRALHGPRRLEPDAVSVVIPVKDNQAGLDRLRDSLSPLKLLEVIVVDNNSSPPVRIPEGPSETPMRVVFGSTPGPAAARNTGARHAAGEWLLFLDSDCTVSSDLLLRYAQAIDGSLAYTGAIRASDRGPIGRFYDRHSVLEPPRDEHGSIYVVTANALVWRPAFDAVDGFDERFRLAAAEDVDLGVRLGGIGRLGFVADASVVHDYGGLAAFARRFWRYGRGNIRLAAKYGGEWGRPASVWRERSITALLLATVRLVAFSLGQQHEMRVGHRSA